MTLILNIRPGNPRMSCAPCTIVRIGDKNRAISNSLALEGMRCFFILGTPRKGQEACGEKTVAPPGSELIGCVNRTIGTALYVQIGVSEPSNGTTTMISVNS